MTATRLFLLAHQDDEIGAMHAIASLGERGGRPICVFLTNGAFAGVTPERRNRESTLVLEALGVETRDIHFLGQKAGIADGRLVEHLDRALQELIAIATSNGPVEAVIMHAWEGGHHDHDATHLIGRALARHLGVEAASRQFPLYSAPPSGKGLRYAFLDARRAAIETHRLSLRQALTYASQLRHYRSQARVMLQLGPYILRSWLVARVEALQALPQIDAGVRPAEHLLYERWKLYDWPRFAAHATAFVASEGGTARAAREARA